MSLRIRQRQKLLEALLAPLPKITDVCLCRWFPDLAGPLEEVIVQPGKFISSIHRRENRVWVTFKEPAKPEKPWSPFRWPDWDD